MINGNGKIVALKLEIRRETRRAIRRDAMTTIAQCRLPANAFVGNAKSRVHLSHRRAYDERKMRISRPRSEATRGERDEMHINFGS